MDEVRGRRAPGPFWWSTIDSLSIPGSPPMPDPIDTPGTLSFASSVMSMRPASSQRLAGGIDAVDDERIDLALHLVIDALGRIEAVFVAGGLHLAGDAAFLVGSRRSA